MRNAREPEQCAAAAAVLDIVEKMTKLPRENLMEYSKKAQSSPSPRSSCVVSRLKDTWVITTETIYTYMYTTRVAECQ